MLEQHIHGLLQDIESDGVLFLVPLINDCRALREEALLSDILMLAAGVEVFPREASSVDKDQWFQQRTVWREYARAEHESIEQRVQHWWDQQRSQAIAPLIRQLDRIASITRDYQYLSSVSTLFESASLLSLIHI